MAFDYPKDITGLEEDKKEAGQRPEKEHPDRGAKEEDADAKKMQAGTEEKKEKSSVAESDKTFDDIFKQPPPAPEKKKEGKKAPPKSAATYWLSLDTWVDVEGLKKGLKKTRTRIESNLHGLLSIEQEINDDVLEELEAALIEADMGVRFVTALVKEIREAWELREFTDTTGMKAFLKKKLKERFKDGRRDLHVAPEPPTVILVAGVNGSGKTTSIAKLGNMLVKEGKKVLLAAGDTFRAGATEQLEIWSDRIGAQIVKHGEGADPAAVAYDSIEAAIARGVDVVIVDTAGRLHTKQNLMQELGKIKRVISKRIEGAPHEVLMVVDATTGQNAISQVKLFKEAVDITGLFLAKLDGTAKGGIVIGMQDEVKIPVKFLGLGEGAEDIQKFDPDTFVDALFD
ncbi:MAG: signal recognition particle-docking protein FtsY [Candidatus Brocadiales bacterium]